jgi:hypothetical protein
MKPKYQIQNVQQGYWFLPRGVILGTCHLTHHEVRKNLGLVNIQGRSGSLVGATGAGACCYWSSCISVRRLSMMLSWFVSTTPQSCTTSSSSSSSSYKFWISRSFTVWNCSNSRALILAASSAILRRTRCLSNSSSHSD